jgi:hypothetical protein
MRATFALIILTLAALVSTAAETTRTPQREKALHRIESCLRLNDVSGRRCKHLKQDVQGLVDLYRAGDKSVLPTLFRFTYLTDFYDEALLSDTAGFLFAMAQLPAREQQGVADGLAGGPQFGLRNSDRFKALRKLLSSYPADSAIKPTAKLALKSLETYNAWRFVAYFPPRAFDSRTAGFQLAWYSSAMYYMGERPLWPPADCDEKIYRFTHLGAFSGPKAITLKVLPDGTGQVNIVEGQNALRGAPQERTAFATSESVSLFMRALEQAHFWQLPTHSDRRGEDGAEWIFEGVQHNNYQVVVRWCPGTYEHAPEDAAFADAARVLFQIAGGKLGTC